MPPQFQEPLLSRDQRRFTLGLLVGVIAIFWFGWELNLDELLEILQAVKNRMGCIGGSDFIGRVCDTGTQMVRLASPHGL